MVDRYYYSQSQYNHTSHYSTTSNPSFSSTLLDAVYRSIDRGEDTTMKQNNYASSEEMANFQRACMIEKWMEKKASDQKVVTRAKSVTEKPRKDRENSSTSSSDSSAGGFFSEAEYTFPIQRPKPVRTSGSEFVREKTKINNHNNNNNNKNRNGFDSVNRQSENKPSGLSKTKSRALKIYGDLKKVKQPISPGGKLAGFLNTLFTGGGGGNVKKPKSSSSGESPSLKSANASTCSSASSFSRSCLSKTPSCGGKYANGAKRSVRFYIVDDDCQKPLKSHHNNAIKESVVNDELMAHVMEKNRRIEEAARDLLRNYQKKFVVDDDDEDEDEDDDDAASYASSDLFELDNLSAIGMDHQRYREELPVYETTHLENNRAIANRCML